MGIKKAILITLLFSSVLGFSQTKTKEFTGGITINTRSNFIAGIQAKYTRRIDKMLYQGYGIEIVNIKHPKELKVPSLKTAKTFIVGKNNYLFSIKPNINIEKILFEKDPNEGIRVSILAAVGPSLGILKPYVIEYEDTAGAVSKAQYNPEIHTSFGSINGNAGIFEKFGQSKFIVGAHIKASLVFEYSAIKNRLSSIETGFMYEQLTKKAQLNPYVSSESSFFTAFVNISLGKKL